MISKEKKKFNGVAVYPLTVTLRQLFKSLIRPSTIVYPFERLEKPKEEYFKAKGDIWSRYRGLIALNLPTCISCGACARACPNKCLTMTKVENNPDSKTKTHMHPSIDFGRCLFCELCVQACPVTDCLDMTNIYDVTTYTREKLYYPTTKLYETYQKAKKEGNITSMSKGKVATTKKEG